MNDLVILQLPVALILYGLGLTFCAFDRHYKSTNGVLTVVSTLLAVGGTVYALVMGATMMECAVVLMIFLLLHMGVKE